MGQEVRVRAWRYWRGFPFPEATIWDKLRLRSEPGTLSLRAGRLTFVKSSGGDPVVDVPVSDAKVRYPAYAFGSTMVVETPQGKQKFAFYPLDSSTPGGGVVEQMRGRARGRELRKALKQG